MLLIIEFNFYKILPCIRACDNYRIVAVMSLQNLLIISNQFHGLYKVVYTMIDKQMLCIYCRLTLNNIYIKLTSLSENCKRRLCVSSPTTRGLSFCDFFIIVFVICIFSTNHCRRLIRGMNCLTFSSTWVHPTPGFTTSYVCSSFYFSVLRCVWVFLFFFGFFLSLSCVLCAKCCQCLWIVLSWFPL